MNNKTLLGFFLGLAQLSLAQRDLSVQDAVFTALANNFDIQIAHEQVGINEMNNRWGQAGLFPTVTLNASFNNAIQDNTNNPFTFTPGLILQQSVAPSINVNWNLFSGFAVKINKQRLELLEEQTKGNAVVLIEQTTQDVIQAYYQVQIQTQRLRVIEELLKVSRQQLKYQELKEKYGSANSLELLQFNNQYLTDSSNLLVQKMNRQSAIRNLQILMNDSTLNEIRLTDEMAFNFPAFNLADLENAMISQNMQLKNQLVAIELQERQTQLQKSFLYPTLSLQMGASPNFGHFRQLNANGLDQNTTVIQYFGNLNLRYTLYNNYQTKRAVEISRIQEDIAQLQYEKLRNTLLVALRNMYDQYTIRRNLTSISEANLNYAKQAFELAQSRYKNGQINSVQLSNFQNNFQTASLTHVENQYNVLMAYLEIMRMCGNIGLVNSN